MKHTRIALWIAGAALALSLSGPAYAQPEDDDGAPPTAEVQERVKKMRGKVLREKVGLSEEKAKKVEAIFDALEPERRKVREEVRTARKQLRELFKADSDDQAAYDAALAKLREATKKTVALRDKQFEALKKELTPKEHAKIVHRLDKLRKKVHRQGNRGKQGRRGRPGPRGEGAPDDGE